jgi:hypothetical protein
VPPENCGVKGRKWFFFCVDCFPGKEAYRTYDNTPPPPPTNNNQNEGDNTKFAFNSPVDVNDSQSNDSGIASGSPVSSRENSIVQMLIKISNQCEKLKNEFNAYQQTTKTVISEMKDKIEAVTIVVSEQKDIIIALKRENEKAETELSECIVNHFQQNLLSNTIEISGLNDLTEEDATESLIQIAASVNVQLKKQHIKSTRRLNNGKREITISEREKCAELISASFKNVIKIPQQTPTTLHNTKQKHGEKTSTHRIFISNALTTTNQLFYKKLRDLKKEGIISKISFSNGLFAVHHPGKQQLVYIYNNKQLKEIESNL